MTSPIDDLHTVRDYLRFASSQFSASRVFFGHGTDNVWDEAVQLVMRSLHLPLENNTLFLDARLTRGERELVLERIRRRIEERVPMAYLLGEAWFMGMPFHVDERVLVPRSPIGELIENGFQPWLGDKPVGRVLDLCTGSGCIGIGVASVFEEAHVDLSDISQDALAVAASNIELHELSDRVRTIQSDVFASISGKYDIIVSNPPYVDAEDLADMPEEFHHEPALGLAAGNDGLDIAHRIIAGAAEHLTPGGLLVVEVGNSWVALDEAYPDLPFTWLEFSNGGDGVFAIAEQDLRQWCSNS
ncbi:MULTISPECIES: 50S ribosomal protein L3 N(5)-glutamine methyltransferase [unclassified Marinobacter]|uniref:50S ribosomal protein L3 N(5)-glutamine methyltransferase n=1 Tax=unclassified Marinobacter TaxID=83889 RepID=UPI0026E1746C|nr:MULTISPECIES: 50S ribosomal protein L3 N(5)-glutamine methyltransferase [unclassified Marinobacter]MDO6442460.1 50S ribosomal protein L3 N(5)-glutamine methyltransferase [Marinobacter sp. 2_MG-2023]MDO6824516.1 50S ribosomal protein L3 N(5)-glutamine methyltransferase [Marinobacter sp. 1_MG-2023]